MSQSELFCGKMKTLLFLALLGAVACAADELPLAEACNAENCQLPDCRCSTTDIPGGLDRRDTPQFVTITFDDAVTAAAMANYREVLYNRRNSNGCPAGATFYVSHEWTDYSAVNELYNNGFEIALHSISHRTPQTYWRDASYDDIKMEIADQREQIAHFANIPESEVSGVRLPFLQLSGNNSFQVMKDFDLGYDCSWPTTSMTNPGLWPYTLDYASTQDCQIPPCPTASLPGVWVQPMVAWFDLRGFPCSMADACPFPPDLTDADAWYRFILQNFERQYLGNRAPFGIYLHEAYLRGWPRVKEALIRFIQLINTLPDVYMVNSDQVLGWTQNPVPVNEYREQPCRTRETSACNPRRTCALTGAHNNWAYWVTICRECPASYPWVGNHLGQ